MMGGWRLDLRGAALVAAVMAAACSAPPLAPPDMAETRPGGGIGGTGIGAGETGVIGTVTGFGSVYVNGLRIDVDDAFPVRSALGDVPVAELREGDVVELIGTRTDAVIRPDRMVRLLALVGVADVPSSREGHALSVNGIAVDLEPRAALLPESAVLADFAGRRVAVSGLWHDGRVVASRVDALPDQPGAGAAIALVAGTIDSESVGQPRIGPLVIVSADGRDLPDGSYVTVSGAYRDGRFIARVVRVGRPALPAALQRLSVEAYAESGRAVPALDGVGLPVEEGTRLDEMDGRRGVFIGGFDGSFRIEHGIPLPEGHAARRRALDAVGDGFQPQTGAIDLR